MKALSAVIAAIPLLFASIAVGGIAAKTGVHGSLHDMTLMAPASADQMGRVCVYCHAPHHAVVRDGSAQLPLWNHNLTPDNQFTPYTWATANNSNKGVFDIVDPLAGPSRLCMSCHDGSIAIDEHGTAFPDGGTKTIFQIGSTKDGAGRANLSKDLSNTHPIGFNFNEVAAFRNSKALNGTGTQTHGEFADGTEIVVSALGYATRIQINDTNNGKYNTVTRAASGKRIADNLYGGNIMTCCTCHEVHNKENASQESYTDGVARPNGIGGTQTVPNYFLYAKQAGSLICLSCHVK